MGVIMQIIRKIVYGYKADSKSYEKYLRSIGVSVGENFKIFCPTDTIFDTQNPYLISIGNDVAMTGPVTVMTHDYSWRVFKNLDGSIIGNQRPVIIGNNVFIGWGATILGGSTIGDNVVIGAGSVVSSKCEDNSVYAGVPAKRIMSIVEYRQKRQSNQLQEARDIFLHYKKRFGDNPPIRVFDSYFPIFTSKENMDSIMDVFEDRIDLEGRRDLSIDYLNNQNKALFSDFGAFTDYCCKWVIKDE